MLSLQTLSNKGLQQNMHLFGIEIIVAQLIIFSYSMKEWLEQSQAILYFQG